jgi:hypothetical protein
MAVTTELKTGSTITVGKNTIAQPYLGVTPLCTGSGNQPNAVAIATLTPTATTCAYLCGLIATGSGATSAKPVVVTVDGLLGGTRSFCYGFIQPIAAVNTPLILNFDPPLSAADINTPIVVTVPAGGVGNLNSMVTAYGFYSTMPTI